jgi:hypothetical protein
MIIIIIIITTIKIFGCDEHIMGATYDLLAKILQTQDNFGEETRELFERAVAVPLRKEGPDGLSTAMGNNNIGRYYYDLAGLQLTKKTKKKHLRLAQTHYQEAFRIYLKKYGPTHEKTINAKNKVEDVIAKLLCRCPIGMCDFTTRGTSY